MPLQPTLLGAVLDEKLELHSALCRREAAGFVKAIQGGEDWVVACTQEKRLFTELAAQAGTANGSARTGAGVAPAPIKFVNIRETGGWSKDASRAMPKIAALLAAAHLPDPEPVSTVSYSSAGRTLIIGPADEAERVAALLSDVLVIGVFSTGAGQEGSLQERRFPVLSGQLRSLSGWLGAFELIWARSNPIALDLCTRCNACVAACPEQAIGLDYQIDLARCRSHRTCVKVCLAAGAIDFERGEQEFSERFDLVLDMRSEPAFAGHALPQGYFHWKGDEFQTLLSMRELVGEYEKPKFFAYRQKICAHSRSEKLGCSSCIEVCSALAISSDKSRQQIKVNPKLCVGCGACSTVCPTGALSYLYPRVADLGTRIKTMLATYGRAGGAKPVLLLHSEGEGRRMIERLGRAAQLGKAQGVPAETMPVELWHSASTGIDLWLSALAYGASQVAVLTTTEEAPQYRQALKAQMAVAQAILNGLGYTGTHLHLLNADSLADLDGALQAISKSSPVAVASPGRFAVAQEKRNTLELALDHLIDKAPLQPASIPLPGSGSPFGSLQVDKDKCTLCLSCVSACPAAALQDNPEAPQLKFIEKNCVQCGLCVSTCPEAAITLEPRLLLGASRKEARVINEMPPYACIRCGKPFGTLRAVESMLVKLAGHSMFQGEALLRLKMCGDCRVIDIHSSAKEVRITDI